MIWIKIDCDSNVSFVDLKGRLEDFYKAINCDTIQIVRVLPEKPYFDNLRMILDDNGKVFNKPLNVLATYLYAYEYDAIVGDVLIGQLNDLGDDVVGFDDVKQAEHTLNVAWSSVLKKLGINLT